MAVNVKDPQFGAVGDGFADDGPAIQRAVDFAKALSVPGNVNVRYKATVYFPPGYYKINTTINLTNINGIYLQGDGGRYLNSIIIGNTGGPIFDFSGSSLSGCEGLTFQSSAGYGTNRSTIGVLFALTSNGGVNCGIRNCYFEMFDFPTANSGLGTIGVLNVRAEEFFIHECLIRANTPVLFSNKANLSDTGTNFTVTSPFQTLASGTGSMGVVSIKGVSLQGYEKRQPAMILNGTNSITFDGYLGRDSATTGSNETAILCSQYTTNLRINATIESYSRILQTLVAGFEHNDLNIVIANSASPATELIDFTGCIVKGLKARISIPNPSERTNRTVLYHAPNGGGYQQAAGSIINSEITCTDVAENQFIITPNLLKNSNNVLFNTEQPFEKRGGRLRQLFTQIVSAGTNGAPAAATAIRFRQANLLPFNNTNAGYYRIWIDGIVRGGSPGSGGYVTLGFQSQITVNQLFDGRFDPVSVTVITLNRSYTNATYLDISGVNISLTFSGLIGTVTITPRVSGTGIGEPLFYEGQIEIQSNFQANDPVPFK